MHDADRDLIPDEIESFWRRLLSPAAATFVPRRLLQSAQEFVELEASSGIVLLLAAIVALVWANSAWDDAYFDFIHTRLVIDLSLVRIDESLQHWVNDALMTLFFFLVGLEIKREVVHGELSTVRRAALPAAAALGGMAVPALIYLAFNAGGEGADGWGIPMATDIAFALGVLSLLGPRVPLSVKVFLLALAIADDIGAILVIALFYTETVDVEALALAAAILGLVVVLNRGGVRSIGVYGVAGVALWLATFESGIHATLAGVVLGLLTPASPWYDPRQFANTTRTLIERYEQGLLERDIGAQQAMLAQVSDVSRDTEAPLERLERGLHVWVSFVVVPLFALVNAGVAVSGDTANQALDGPVFQGVVLGLLLGKPVGIVLFTVVAVRLGLGEMPRGARWSHIAGVGLLGGIGFTVSLLITSLAFGEGTLASEAKLAVLGASVVAGLAGYTFLRVGAPPRPEAVGSEAQR
jgi:NhaA family Na+:H+ antiporter